MKDTAVGSPSGTAPTTPKIRSQLRTPVAGQMNKSVSLPSLSTSGSPSAPASGRRASPPGSPSGRPSGRKTPKKLNLDKSASVTLQSFQNERVTDKALIESMSDFFGPKFFVDDWFPSWLTKRPDFLRLCPRYCGSQKVFNSISKEISSEYFVERALRNSDFLSTLDDQAIRNLTKKCIVSQYRPGGVIFEQGDAADGMYIVVRGSVAIRITNAEGVTKEVLRLKDNAVFGELGCYSSAPRLATAVCVGQGPTIFAKIEQYTYKQEIFAIERDNMMRRIDWFEKGDCPFIANNFSRRRQMFLAGNVTSKLYSPGEVIYREGDKVDSMFIIRYGKCNARKNLRLKQEGIEFPYAITFATFNSGDFFGEEIAVGATERILRVVAGGGGAEVIVILQGVAQNIFTHKVWEKLKEHYNKWEPRIETRYNKCMTELGVRKLKYDVRKNTFQDKYQVRAGYRDEYATTVDVLMDIEKLRSNYLQEEYCSRMNKTIPDQDTHVVDIKRVETELWRDKRVEKLRLAARMSSSYDEADEATEEEEAVKLERRRPSTNEMRASTDELHTQLNYVDVDIKMREMKEVNAKKIFDITRKIQDLERKMEKGGDGDESRNESKN